jgi:hypothetical protein
VGRRPGSSKFIKAAFFGPPKTGKTTLATSGKKVLLVQFDPEGDISATLKGREDITVVEPESYQVTNSLVRSLYTTDAGVFDYVVFDSITFMFQLFGGKEITAAYQSNTNIMRPYGRAGAAVSQIIADSVRLPMHVVFTAHLTREDDDGAVAQDVTLGEHEVKLAVTPMVWKTLGPAVSIIGRTYKSVNIRNKETKYMVSFNDGERSPAGSREAMPAELEITTTTLDALAETLKEV